MVEEREVEKMKSKKREWEERLFLLPGMVFLLLCMSEVQLDRYWFPPRFKCHYYNFAGILLWWPLVWFTGVTAG